MRNALFAFVIFLAVAQLGLGLAGAAWGLARGQCSVEVSAGLDPAGKVIQRDSSERCTASAIMVAMGATVAAGGIVALGGLLVGSRHPLAGMVVILAGAVLGLPLGYTLILGIVPLLLAALGVLTIRLASEERRHGVVRIHP